MSKHLKSHNGPPKIVHVGGYNTGVSTSRELVALTGEAILFPTSAAATTIVSTSTNDALAGTGLQSATFECLDDNFDVYEEAVEMDGTTPVAFATAALAVNGMKDVVCGSGLEVAGTVDVQHGVNYVARLYPGAQRVLHGHYTIPRGMTGIIEHIYASNQSNSATYCEIELGVRKPGEAWQYTRIGQACGAYSANVSVPMHFEVPEKSRAGIFATASGASIVSSLFRMKVS